MKKSIGSFVHWFIGPKKLLKQLKASISPINRIGYLRFIKIPIERHSCEGRNLKAPYKIFAFNNNDSVGYPKHQSIKDEHLFI